VLDVFLGDASGAFGARSPDTGTSPFELPEDPESFYL
jgi:hypothetical protein